MTVEFNLPERPRILVVNMRRLGDVLLTTPLLRTLRRGFPKASLDILVFRGSEAILQGNPDIDDVLTLSERATLKETFALMRRMFRRYDLVLSTQGGDRPTFFALLASGRRIGLMPPKGSGRWWKQWAYHVAIPHELDRHRIESLFLLSDALGLPQQPSLVCPQGSSAEDVAPSGPYAVLHANPLYRYKRWNDAGWRELSRSLAKRGYAVVATEGPDPAERAYVDSLWAGEASVIRLRNLPFAKLAALLRGASIYVGPDTSMTHLAAASGCPTVAIYGPTSPLLIGPWPVGGLAEPWAPAGRIQQQGNVWVVQNPLPCLPCEKLGCDGHLDSRAQCLDELSAQQVLAAVDQALGLVRQRNAQWRSGQKAGMEGGTPLHPVKP